ncbi:hypothetical protein AB0O22_38225 [Streptomyces sp. NPDC091204]|uniref:hypothetical protein n=1 Tax=Streptomyces sp. NPDC091204 TaxID=3155299 RepID=UPI0034346EF2
MKADGWLGFVPGWGIRAYAAPDEPPLYEAAFCYGCDRAWAWAWVWVWVWGPRIPEALHRQTFDSASPYAQYLRLRFREEGPV